MSDNRLQELRRRWEASGDTGDEAAYLRERVRVGELSPERLELAANCGQAGACQVLEQVPNRTRVGLEEHDWAWGLHRWGREVSRRGAVALGLLGVEALMASVDESRASYLVGLQEALLAVDPQSPDNPLAARALGEWRSDEARRRRQELETPSQPPANLCLQIAWFALIEINRTGEATRTEVVNLGKLLRHALRVSPGLAVHTLSAALVEWALGDSHTLQPPTSSQILAMRQARKDNRPSGLNEPPLSPQQWLGLAAHCGHGGAQEQLASYQPLPDLQDTRMRRHLWLYRLHDWGATTFARAAIAISEHMAAEDPLVECLHESVRAWIRSPTSANARAAAATVADLRAKPITNQAYFEVVAATGELPQGVTPPWGESYFGCGKLKQIIRLARKSGLLNQPAEELICEALIAEAADKIPLAR